MNTLYKLTDVQGNTYGRTHWGQGVRHEVMLMRQGRRLCSDGVIHAYRSVAQALLLNPIQGRHLPPLLWRAESPDIAVDDGTKVGVWALTTMEQIELPAWYTERALLLRVVVRFAIVCASAVLPVFERVNPNDQRPRRAIAAAQRRLASVTTGSARIAVGEAYAASQPEDFLGTNVAPGSHEAAHAAIYAAAAASFSCATYTTAGVPLAAEYAADAALSAQYAALRAELGSLFSLVQLAAQAVEAETTVKGVA